MKITLIFTPNRINPHYKPVAFRDERLGFIPPISLLSVAAIMEKENVTVDIIDMEAEQLGYEATLERIRNFSPDLLGFTITSLSFHATLHWIIQLKQDTALPTLVGGEHVRIYPYETMTHQAIDFCIIGEAELPIPEFIKAFRKGDGYDGVKSLGFRKDGKIIIDRTLQYVEDMDTIPFPARHLIKNELYENILTKKKNFTAFISSRGCPFNCAFCNHNHQKYRTRSVNNVVDEIELNMKQFGIHDFDIYDSTFTADRKRVIAICNEICRRGLKVGFAVRSRVDVITVDMIDSLKKAGCHTIMYGIESSNQEILKRMNKGITTDVVIEKVQRTHQSGIKVLGFFLFGFPGETHQTITETINFALKLPLDYALFSILLPQPETEIYEYYRKHGLRDYWAEYTLDETKGGLIEFIETGVTREEASAYAVTAYKKFFFRSRIILDRLKNLDSLGEFKRLLGGAIGILTSRVKNQTKTVQ